MSGAAPPARSTGALSCDRGLPGDDEPPGTRADAGPAFCRDCNCLQQSMPQLTRGRGSRLRDFASIRRQKSDCARSHYPREQKHRDHRHGNAARLVIVSIDTVIRADCRGACRGRATSPTSPSWEQRSSTTCCITMLIPSPARGPSQPKRSWRRSAAASMLSKPQGNQVSEAEHQIQSNSPRRMPKWLLPRCMAVPASTTYAWSEGGTRSRRASICCRPLTLLDCGLDGSLHVPRY